MQQQVLPLKSGGREFYVWFALLFACSMLIVWCLSTAIMSPIDHLSCHLLSALDDKIFSIG